MKTIQSVATTRTVTILYHCSEGCVVAETVRLLSLRYVWHVYSTYLCATVQVDITGSFLTCFEVHF